MKVNSGLQVMIRLDESAKLVAYMKESAALHYIYVTDFIFKPLIC